jgi:hypothetical protein
MTFDVPGSVNDGSAAAASAKYLQGEVAVDGRTYVLTVAKL